MRTNTIICVAAALIALMSCKKEEVATYSDLTSSRYMYFHKVSGGLSVDSLDVSFYKFPGETIIDVPITVLASGYSKEDAQYLISCQADGTTALASDYELPSSFVFKGGETSATFNIRLKYREEFDNEIVRIVLAVEEYGSFKKGPSEDCTYILKVHNNMVKPDWWTSTVTSYYLGTYTAKKYKLFLQVCKVDLEGADNNLIRHYALVFKQWLADQKAAGNTVTEDDGTEMTVVAGGKNK